MFISSLICQFFKLIEKSPLHDEDLCIFCFDIILFILLVLLLIAFVLLIRKICNSSSSSSSPTIWLDYEDPSSTEELSLKLGIIPQKEE